MDPTQSQTLLWFSEEKNKFKDSQSSRKSSFSIFNLSYENGLLKMRWKKCSCMDGWSMSYLTTIKGAETTAPPSQGTGVWNSLNMVRSTSSLDLPDKTETVWNLDFGLQNSVLNLRDSNPMCGHLISFASGHNMCGNLIRATPEILGWHSTVH